MPPFFCSLPAQASELRATRADTSGPVGPPQLAPTASIPFQFLSLCPSELRRRSSPPFLPVPVPQGTLAQARQLWLFNPRGSVRGRPLPPSVSFVGLPWHPCSAPRRSRSALAAPPSALGIRDRNRAHSVENRLVPVSRGGDGEGSGDEPDLAEH